MYEYVCVRVYVCMCAYVCICLRLCVCECMCLRVKFHTNKNIVIKQRKGTKDANIHYLLHRDSYTGLLTPCKPPHEGSMKAQTEAGV